MRRESPLAKDAAHQVGSGESSDGRGDLADYLPCSKIREYTAGQPIYDGDQISEGIFLVIIGRVKVCRTTDDGRQIIIDIYVAGDFFGESGFSGRQSRVERAEAIETAEVMTWSTTVLEKLLVRRPKLSIALIGLMARRTADLEARVVSFSVDTAECRLIRSLLRLSARCGGQSADGFAEMPPFTHDLLAQYLGTSREIITHLMTGLRRRGFLRYSRRGIGINRVALCEWLIKRRKKSPLAK